MGIEAAHPPTLPLLAVVWISLISGAILLSAGRDLVRGIARLIRRQTVAPLPNTPPGWLLRRGMLLVPAAFPGVFLACSP